VISISRDQLEMMKKQMLALGNFNEVKRINKIIEFQSDRL